MYQSVVFNTYCFINLVPVALIPGDYALFEERMLDEVRVDGAELKWRALFAEVAEALQRGDSLARKRA